MACQVVEWVWIINSKGKMQKPAGESLRVFCLPTVAV